MALYRHTASGFLQEHAVNPGAGYVAISTQPTDTQVNRVAWWRDLDTYGQTSAWHPSVYRSPEDPAEAALTMRFSREAAFISADPDGAVTDAYLAANTEVRIYRGSTDVTITEGWQLTKVEDGCTSTLTQSGGVYTLQITNVPLLATRQGYVRITAARVGVSVVQDFSFIKVLQGNDGADGGSGATVVLTNDSHTVPFTDGVGDYTGSGTGVSVYLGATQLAAHATNTTNCYRITAVSASGITAGSLAADKGSIGTHSAMTAATAIVTLTINIYNASGLYATLNKQQTLSRNSNGLLATITATALVVKKSAAGVFTPASVVTFSAITKNLPPGKTTADLIWWYSFTGGSATTTGWDGSWANAGPLNLGINTDYAGNPVWFWLPDSQPPITIGLSISGDTSILDRLTLAYAKDGTDGSTGTRGSRQILVTTAGGTWSDQTAWQGIVSQTGTNPVPADLVTIAKSDGTTATSKFYVSGGDGITTWGTWSTPTAYINGNLLVTGTVGANKITAGSITATQISATAGITAAQIDSRGLSIKDDSGNIILQAGSPLNPAYQNNSGQNFCPSMRRWAIGAGHTFSTTETAAIDGCSITSPPANDQPSYSTPFSLQPYQYTVSFKALMYGGASRTMTVVLMRVSDSAVLTQSTINLTTSITRYSFTYTSGVAVSARIFAYCNTGAAYGQIWEVQVERGSAMTPWIPAIPDAVTINNPLTSSNVSTYIASAAIGSAYISDLAANKVSAGTLSAGVIYSGTISASNILTGTLTSQTLTLNGGAIKSNNFSTGSTGWNIDGLGNAEFNTVMVRTKNISSTEGVTASGGFYSADTNTSIPNSIWQTFWTPNQPAVTYGRGSIVFSGVMQIYISVFTNNFANVFIEFLRNGSTVYQSGLIALNDKTTMLMVPFMYIDSTKSSSATTYEGRIQRSATSDACKVGSLSEYWVEYKR